MLSSSLGNIFTRGLEVITQRLEDEARRRTLFSQLNQRAQRVAVMSEGLLTYLDEEKVTSLAVDLHTQPHFNYSLIEVVSPKVLQFINRKWAHHFKAAGAPMAFAPTDWRRFYRDRGWEPVEFEEMSQTAHRMNREPGMMRVFRIIDQVFPGWGAKTAQDLGIGCRVASPGIESTVVRFGGGKSSTREGAVEVAIQVERQKIDVGLGVARPSRMEARSSKKKWLLTGNTLSMFFLSEEG